MKRLLLALTLFALLAMPASAGGVQRGIAMACGNIQVPKAFGIVGFWHNWSHSPSYFADPLWMPMVRCWNQLRSTYPCTSLDTLETVAQQARDYPGRSWLLGNEPNDASQDNWTVEQAVTVYGSMGRAIITADPTARLILGGVNLAPPGYDYVNPQTGQAYMQQLLALWPADVPLSGLQWHIYLQDYWPADGTMPKPQQRVQVVRGREVVDAAISFTHSYNPSWETWITEFGVLGASAASLPVDSVARYITLMRVYMERHDVQRFAWFSWDDSCMEPGFFSWSLVDSSLLITAYRGY